MNVKQLPTGSVVECVAYADDLFFLVVGNTLFTLEQRRRRDFNKQNRREVAERHLASRSRYVDINIADDLYLYRHLIEFRTRLNKLVYTHLLRHAMWIRPKLLGVSRVGLLCWVRLRVRFRAGNHFRAIGKLLTYYPVCQFLPIPCRYCWVFLFLI